MLSQFNTSFLQYILVLQLPVYVHITTANMYYIEHFTFRLPQPTIPNPGLVLPYIKDAIIIGVVAFTQSVSMSKILARKDNYSINPSQVS